MDRKRTAEKLGSSRSDDANGFVSGAYEEDGQLQHTILYLDAIPYIQCSSALHFHQPPGLYNTLYTIHLWLYKLDNQCSGFVFLYLILMRKPYITAVHLGHHSSMTSPNFSTPNLDIHLPIPHMHAYGELRDICAVRRSRIFIFYKQSTLYLSRDYY